jgi:hypothetical protein
MTWNLQRSNTKLRKITPFIVLYICGVSCVHVHGGACAHICTCVYRPEVDVKCSPPLLPSTLFFEARSFTEPGIYWCSRAGWPVLPQHHAEITTMCFYGDARDPISGPTLAQQAFYLLSHLQPSSDISPQCIMSWIMFSLLLPFHLSSPLSWTRCSTQPVLILSSYFLLNLDFA